MAKKINIIGRRAKRIRVVDKPRRRIEPAEVAAALGAEPCGEYIGENLDLVSLAELGTQLLHRLRSTGGRPALSDATEFCRVPLSPEDMKAVEKITNQIEQSTGTKPSPGQVASIILRTYLDAMKNASAHDCDQDRSRSLPFINVPWPSELNHKRNECRPVQEIVQEARSTWGTRRAG